MMRKLRRTLSFRSRRKYNARSDPQQWESDGVNIKHGGLSFPVKYLGAVPVTESRGTQVCSTAVQQLKLNATGKKKRVTLWVTEDTIRVIDDQTKSLVVDQVIEKVSFCTPDPHDERLFSYICRDGTTRRWMCHCFRVTRDTGERVSHAVGCAFAACLQRKQQQNTMNQNFQRSQSTRKSASRANGVKLPMESVEQLQMLNKEEYEEKVRKAKEASEVKPAATASPASSSGPSTAQPKSPKSSSNTYARPRPTVNLDPFTRHTSLRYRSTPLSHDVLTQQSGSSTYNALVDDLSPPRLAGNGVLSEESSSVQPAVIRAQSVKQTTTTSSVTHSANTTINPDDWLTPSVPISNTPLVQQPAPATPSSPMNPFSTATSVPQQAPPVAGWAATVQVSNLQHQQLVIQQQQQQTQQQHVAAQQQHVAAQQQHVAANPFQDSFGKNWEKSSDSNPFGSKQTHNERFV